MLRMEKGVLTRSISERDRKVTEMGQVVLSPDAKRDYAEKYGSKAFVFQKAREMEASFALVNESADKDKEILAA